MGLTKWGRIRSSGVPAKAGTLADLHDATRRSDRIAKHTAAEWRETLRISYPRLLAKCQSARIAKKLSLKEIACRMLCNPLELPKSSAQRKSHAESFAILSKRRSRVDPRGSRLQPGRFCAGKRCISQFALIPKESMPRYRS